MYKIDSTCESMLTHKINRDAAAEEIRQWLLQQVRDFRDPYEEFPTISSAGNGFRLSYRGISKVIVVPPSVIAP